MNKTLVIGASGQIGKMLCSILGQNEIPTVALVRNQERGRELAGPGIEIFEGNLEEDFSEAFTGCDRVVFSAGSGAGTGAEKTLLIDLWGACLAVDYAKKYNIARFLMVSSRGADNPDQGPPAIKPYLVAKHFADKYLQNSGLDYTILRPGRLTNDTETGRIKTERPKKARDQFITRADTARAVFYCLMNPHTIGQIYELYEGELSFEAAL